MAPLQDNEKKGYKFVYSIEGFWPREPGPGRAGFQALLDAEAALKAFETEIKPDQEKNIQTQGISMLQHAFPKKRGLVKPTVIRQPYMFVENAESGKKPVRSCLLESIYFPGYPDFDIGLDPRYRDPELLRAFASGEGRRPPITYQPHNLDDFYVASVLCSLWINWANMVEYIVNYK